MSSRKDPGPGAWAQRLAVNSQGAWSGLREGCIKVSGSCDVQLWHVLRRFSGQCRENELEVLHQGCLQLDTPTHQQRTHKGPTREAGHPTHPHRQPVWMVSPEPPPRGPCGELSCPSAQGHQLLPLCLWVCSVGLTWGHSSPLLPLTIPGP